MTRLLRLTWDLVVLVSVGTMLAALVALGIVGSKGWLARPRLEAAMAGFYGLPAVATAVEVKANPTNSEQPSYETLVEQRTMASLDQSLREGAIEKGLGEMRILESRIKTDRSRFAELQDSFDKRIKQLQLTAEDAAIREVQLTLENIPPKQAKEQILKMLGETAKPGERPPLQAVVAIVKAMQLEKRKKVLQEFKSESDQNFLADILREIREGSPDLPILKEARSKLDRDKLQAE
jgi:hypothetical protein